MEPADCFGCDGHWSDVDSSSARARHTLPPVCSFSSFFQRLFIFRVQVFMSLVRAVPRFIFYVCILMQLSVGLFSEFPF